MEEHASETPPTCFLCLKLSPLPSSKEDEPISLRTIHNYLNLPQNGGGEGGGKGEGELVWWWLCEQCAAVTAKLTDLCEQLEVIQMKVDHSLELFYSKLLEGEEEEHHNHNDNRLNRERRRGHPNYKSFHKVRAHTLHQCERSLRHARRLSVHLKKVRVASRPYEQSHIQSVPQIKTEPMEQDRLLESEPIYPAYEPSPIILSPTSRPTTPPANYLLLKILKEEPSPQIPSAHPHPTVLPVVPFPRTTSPASIESSSPDLVKCSMCPSHPVFSSKPEAARHQEEYHLEVLFPSSSYRNPSIAPSDYKAYCEHVLHTELLLSTATYKHSKSSFFHSCLHCASTLQVHFGTWRQLRTHLLTNHLNMLAAKLWELQRCTPPQELAQIRLPPLDQNEEASSSAGQGQRSLPPPQAPVTRPSVISSSTGLDLSGTGKCCPDCGAEFARRNLVKRHQTESCPLRPDKSKSSRKPTECPDCGVTFLHPGSFYHHRKEKHPHKAASQRPSSNNFLNHFL